MLNHPVQYQEDLIHPRVAKELNDLLRKFGSDEKGFPSNAGQAGSDVQHEHIGDAQEILTNGKCEHYLQVFDSKGKQCVFAPRVDVGRHFVMTGGPEAIREPYE